MAERIIDATDLIAGRVATFAAKAALNGDTVHVINCEKARITGRPAYVLEDQLHMRRRGNINKGPYVYKPSDMYMRRIIRGMLPIRFTRGRRAHERVRCYLGVPEAFKTKPTETFECANVKKVKSVTSISLQQISKAVGGRQ